MLTPFALIRDACRFCAAVSPDRRTGTSCFLSRSRIVVLEVLKAKLRVWLDSPDWYLWMICCTSSSAKRGCLPVGLFIDWRDTFVGIFLFALVSG